MSMHRTSLNSRSNRNDSSKRKSQRSGRLPKATSRYAAEYASWYTCEQLETRRLLTTWTGGGVVNGQAQEATYTYLDANNNTIKVALWGTITAEFLFVKVNPTNDNTSVVGAVPASVANIGAVAGADLFAIYVASASPTASISIAQENTAANSGNPDEGFAAAGADAITVQNAQTGAAQVVTPLADSGSVYIGARLFLKPAVGLKGPPADGIPVTSVPLAQQIGVRPVTADNTLLAGIVTAPGVSLNRILIGGVVTGRVDIGGSINTFYAGEIWTGDAGGILAGSEPSNSALQHNFNVAGDIENLTALGRTGTNVVSSTGAPSYETGFYLSVGGHIGQINTEDGIEGSIYDENLSTLRGLGLPQTEEYITGPAPVANSGETFFEGNAPTSDGTEGVPSLSDAADPAGAAVKNNTFATAQFLGTLFSSAEGHNAIQLEGTVDNASGVGDDVAIYAVALGAEQTITATLKVAQDEAGDLELGIFAPDAGYDDSTTSLLASTYDFRNNLRVANQPISFTSTDAGVYYFAIGYEDDVNFTGAGGFLAGAIDYELDMTGVKNLGVGALDAPNNLDLTSGVSVNQTTQAETLEPTIRVDNGDIGAIISTGGGGTITAGDSSGLAPPFTASNGSIRVIQANGIGTSANGAPAHGPDLYAKGNVGVVRTTGTGSILDINPSFEDDVTATPLDEGLAGTTAAPIGGDYQLIDCAGDFVGNLVADGSIGTLRTSNLGAANAVAPVLHVNAKNSTTPGDIDLIDVTGANFGTLNSGGPRIITGPNGNVRYIHTATDTAIYNDDFFGGDADDPIVYGAGQSAALTDDSGESFTITPFRGETVSGDAGAATTTTTTTTTTTSGETSDVEGDTLSLETYGIEDKGGVVVISVTCTAGDIEVTNTSTSTTTTTGTETQDGTGPTAISVDTSPNGTEDLNASVDFGSIDMVGGGTTLDFDPTTRAFTTAAGGANAVAENDSATFSGKIPINVYDLSATVAAGNAALAGMTSVVNKTSGEIVNFAAQDVQTLEAASLGVAKSDTDAPVAGATILDNTFPFHDQRTLIQIGGTEIADGGTGDATVGTAGYAETIESTGPLGNILCNGTIGDVLPDVGAAAGRGTAEGIVGPVYAAAPGGAAAVDSGNILNINIGQGLGNSGTGNYATTGIFAENYIGTITNQNGSDIRGDVVADGQSGGLPAPETISKITGLPVVSKTTQGLYIANIDLSDGGSIIDANIFTTTTLVQVTAPYAYSGAGFVLPDPSDETINGNSTDDKYGVGNISLTGDGGIIGAVMDVSGFYSISVAGFGILESLVVSLSGSVDGSISAAGYGIRSTQIDGQNSIGSVTAVGTGKELKVTSFSRSVRQSETGATKDAYSNQPLDVYDDLDLFLGVSATSPTRKGSTESGVIADTDLTGVGTLGSITAWRIVGHPAVAATTLAQEEAEEIANTPSMTLSFAQGIGKIDVAENTTDLTVTTGTLNSFSSGKNVVGTTFNVAGKIGDVTAGFLNGSTYINDTGPDGMIDYLATTGNLNANISASAGIGEILVDGSLGSTDITSGAGLDELYVKENVLKTASIAVAKTIGSLTIRHNLLGGSTIQAGAITKRTIGGIANGNIIITGH